MPNDVTFIDESMIRVVDFNDPVSVEEAMIGRDLEADEDRPDDGAIVFGHQAIF